MFQDAGSWTSALAGGQPHMLLPAGPLRAIHPQVGPVSSLASTLVAQGTGQNCMCTCSICCTPPRAPASAGLPEVILEQESTPTYTGHPGTASTPHSGTPQHCQYPTFKDTPARPALGLQTPLESPGLSRGLLSSTSRGRTGLQGAYYRSAALIGIMSSRSLE